MAEVKFHPEAEAEYDEARDWYEARSHQAAERFVTETDRVVKSIATAPGIFPMTRKGYRLALLHRFPYSLIYKERPDGILIVAVAHSSRFDGYRLGRA